MSWRRSAWGPADGTLCRQGVALVAETRDHHANAAVMAAARANWVPR